MRENLKRLPHGLTNNGYTPNVNITLTNNGYTPNVNITPMFLHVKYLGATFIWIHAIRFPKDGQPIRQPFLIFFVTPGRQLESFLIYKANGMTKLLVSRMAYKHSSVRSTWSC